MWTCASTISTGVTPPWPKGYSAGLFGGSEQWRRFDVAFGEPSPGLAHQLLVERWRLCRRNTHYRVVAIGRDHGAVVAKQTIGLFTGLDRADAAPDLVAEHRDAAVGGAEMFETMDGDRALRDLGFEIAGMPLAFLIGIHAELARQHDAPVGPPVGGDDALGFADVAELDLHRVGVVERDDPAAHHRPAERVVVMAGFPDRRDLLQVGQHVLHHSRPDILADPPRGDVDDPDRGLGEFQLREDAEFVGEYRAADDRVQERGMH